MKVLVDKGAAMEESLRSYFLSLGYYVLRGVKFKYNSFDVTDVDLWLYSKTSAIARQRTNVDIKNKKTPQALERIFWAKGLKETLGLDDCIVATTDSRPDVREFGLSHNVSVLDGPFLARLEANSRTNLARLTEEEFLEKANHGSLGKMAGDWKGRYELAKSRVLSDLKFDGCNAYLGDIHYFMEQQISVGVSENVPYRLIYILTSMLLISVDYILKDHVALDNEHRFKLLCEGFRYGDSGKDYATKLIGLAASLAESSGIAPGGKGLVIDELKRQADQIPVEILSEFMSKGAVMATLFDTARELESAAFSPEFKPIRDLTTNAQSLIGILADFFRIDRKKIL